MPFCSIFHQPLSYPYTLQTHTHTLFKTQSSLLFSSLMKLTRLVVKTYRSLLSLKKIFRDEDFFGHTIKILISSKSVFPKLYLWSPGQVSFYWNINLKSYYLLSVKLTDFREVLQQTISLIFFFLSYYLSFFYQKLFCNYHRI